MTTKAQTKPATTALAVQNDATQVETIGEGTFQYREVIEFVNPTYQREKEHTRVRRIANNFDARLFDILKASERDGCLWTIDGGHRLEALRLMGDLHKFVPTWVYSGLSYEEEARIYRVTQEPLSRKALTTGERFIARIEEKDETALALRDLVTGLGIPLDLHMRLTAQKALRAVATVEMIYKRYGDEICSQTLLALTNAWGAGEATNAYHQYLIKGVGAFLGRYRGKVDQERLVACLGDRTPMQVIFSGGQLGQSINSGMGQSIARAVLSLYNNHARGGRLPDWGIDAPYRDEREVVLTMTSQMHEAD